jgi:hypothetical protein
VVGLAALGAGAIYAFKQFEDSERVIRQTDAVLKSTGNAANVTAGHVGELADALSQKAGVDDEVIQAGENMLLTFKNIRNEVGRGNDIFDQATVATVDLAAGMAAASGGEVDLKASSIQLGKALNDPIAGLTSLTRVGVQFSEQQRLQIERMVESGNMLGAQKIILAEVTSQFQGSAEANATASGKMRVAFENLAEAVGKALAPAISTLIGWLTTAAQWFTALPEPVQTLVVAGAGLAAAIGVLTKAFGVLGPAIKAVTLLLMHNPYILIAAATIAIAILIVKNWDTIKDFLLKVWDGIKAAAKFFWDNIAIFIMGPMKLVIDFLIDHWRGFRTAFIAIWEAIRAAIGPIVGAIVDAISQIIDVIQTLIGWAKAALDALTSVGNWTGGTSAATSTNARGSIGFKGPELQHGGEVMRTGLALVHEGEVFSGVGNSMGGLTVIINGDVTGEEVVRKVRDGLLKLKARNATTGL